MKEKVIQAALEEIKIHALKFTMQDITRRLHISKTSLYKVVPSKDQLVHDILDYEISSFNRKEKEITGSSLSSSDKIFRFISLYIDSFHSINTAVYDELRLDYEEDWKKWMHFQQEKIDDLLELIDEGTKKREFRPVNLPVLRRCLILSASGLADSAFLEKNRLSFSDALSSLQDILFNGIRNTHSLS
jgi:AcrR family transcriptional regulator